MLGLIVVTSPTARSPAAAVGPAAAEGRNICSADFPAATSVESAARALESAARALESAAAHLYA